MNLNKAIIIGNLTQNPEVRNTPSGQTVASFTVASNRMWTDQQGQKQQQAEFHNIVAWGRLAEIVGQYLAKGRLCMVEGRIQTHTWDDQQGVRHWKTEIVAENIQLGPRTAVSSAPNEPTAPNNNNYEPTIAVEPVINQPAAGEEEIKVEDIPF